MKLIFAQGNPGTQYAKTRHNVGWQVLNILADKRSVEWAEKSKFRAYVGEFSHDGEKVLLVKPTTFYNDTGISARALVDFYKLDPKTDVLVLHDELALPLGTIRVREKGSDAGNNGIKSLNSHLGPDYARLRIGTGNELRTRVSDVDFVLSQFTKAEAEKLNSAVIPRAIELIDDFIADDLTITSHKDL